MEQILDINGAPKIVVKSYKRYKKSTCQAGFEINRLKFCPMLTIFAVFIRFKQLAVDLWIVLILVNVLNFGLSTMLHLYTDDYKGTQWKIVGLNIKHL